MPAASVVPQASFSDIDKELPDYLRLGIEFDAADRYIRTELPSPWNRYDETLSATEIKAIRKNYPPELSWIASSYGDRLTGYDLAEAVKVWLRANNAENQSVCEVLRERGWRTSSAERDGVGGADVFLSHVQAELPSITLEAMSRIDSRFGVARKGTKSVGSRIWVDFFSLRQCTKTFQPKQVVELIREVGAVYVHMDDATTGSSYPRRTFCVLETVGAIDGGAILMISPPSSGPLQPPRWPWGEIPDYSVDAAAATTRREEDKALVDRFIMEGAGFAHVNQVMERELRSSAVKASWAGIMGCFCWPCSCVGACFDVCCSACNPCGWAVQYTTY